MTISPFSHYVDGDLLADRVKDLRGQYSEEDVAATAVYLGILSITLQSTLFPIFGDLHQLLHHFASQAAGPLLAELVDAGVLDPSAARTYIEAEHADILEYLSVPANDAFAEEEVKPIDEDTFKRLWGSSTTTYEEGLPHA